MSRWKASGIHLGLSIAVFLASLALLLFLWYPQPYFEAAGGKGLLFLIAGVDITLGPLITLIIFKSGKKGLKFDLAVIAFLQVAALVYGMYAVVNGRPAYVVFAVDRFVVVPAVEVNFDQAPPEFDRAPWTGPRVVAAEMPTNLDERHELMFGAAVGGADLEQKARYYRPYADHAKEAGARARSLDVLDKKQPGSAAEVAEFIAHRKLPREAVGYLPMNARKLSMVMLLRKDNGEVLGALPIDGW